MLYRWLLLAWLAIPSLVPCVLASLRYRRSTVSHTLSAASLEQPPAISLPSTPSWAGIRRGVTEHPRVFSLSHLN